MRNKSKQLAKMPKSVFEDIVISESEFKGKTYIDLRIWVRKDSTDELVATKKGISIDKDDWDNFLELLKKVNKK